jgi:hypothetical protein
MKVRSGRRDTGRAVVRGDAITRAARRLQNGENAGENAGEIAGQN